MRYFRVSYTETKKQNRLVTANTPEEARRKVDGGGRFYRIEVTKVKEEFGWQEEGDGIVSRRG